MRETAYMLARTAQTYFPQLLEAKASLQRIIRLRLQVPFDRDFKALAHVPASKGLLFLDVGGNRGQSIDAIRMFCPEAKIISFEPNAFLSSKLTQRYADDPAITIFNFGLGETTEQLELYVPFYRNYMFDGLASFDLDSARYWLKDRVFNFDERLLRIEKRACKLEKLDNLNLEPFFIKLDVQGYELSALRGGAETLRRHRPILLIEAPDDALRQFLSELSYLEYSYVDGRFTRQPHATVNKYFITPETLRRLSLPTSLQVSDE